MTFSGNRSFQQATYEKVKELTLLINSAYRGDLSRQGWTTEADLLEGQRIDEEGVNYLLKDPTIHLITMTIEDALVGCVEVKETPEGAYIGLVTVAPGRQNEGLGRALLEKAEHTARELGFSRAYMTVICTRSELIEWYERRGYQRSEKFLDFPFNDTRCGIPKVTPEELQFLVLEKPLY